MCLEHSARSACKSPSDHETEHARRDGEETVTLRLLRRKPDHWYISSRETPCSGVLGVTVLSQREEGRESGYVGDAGGLCPGLDTWGFSWVEG